jgi:hypothetical protein
VNRERPGAAGGGGPTRNPAATAASGVGKLVDVDAAGHRGDGEVELSADDCGEGQQRLGLLGQACGAPADDVQHAGGDRLPQPVWGQLRRAASDQMASPEQRAVLGQ